MPVARPGIFCPVYEALGTTVESCGVLKKVGRDPCDVRCTGRPMRSDVSSKAGGSDAAVPLGS
jgi:hypothetical protein